jgi:hypothetical protein
MKKMLLAAVSVALVAPGTAAFAQTGSGPALGSTDSRRATAERRDQEADINRAMGQTNRKKAGKTVAAKPADVVIGSPVSDTSGVAIGTIDSVSADAAIVLSGDKRISVPLAGFGKNRNGLVLGLTKAEFDAAVAAAYATQPKG